MLMTPQLPFLPSPARLFSLLSGLLLALFSLLLTPAQAADHWPERTLQLVVPFPGGSSPDLLARTLAEHLSSALEQNVIVDNKPGAGGNIGTSFATRAKPDGHTLLVTINGPIVTAPTLYRDSLNYDPFSQLQPVSLIGTSPNVLVVPADFPAQTLDEFIEYARTHPTELNYGSVGSGSASHLSMAMLEHEADIELTHIPYSSFPQIISALIAGDIHAAFMVPGIAMPQVQADEIRALALTSLEESPLLPGIPTVHDSGFEDFEAISWNALFLPADTPADITAELNRLMQEILRKDEVIERLNTLYFDAQPSSAEELTERMHREKARWDAVIDRLQLSLD